MSQTRLGSAIETAANIACGFAINWSANMLILPHFGLGITPGAAFHLGLWFTVISVIRSYGLRRLFNKIRSLHNAR